MTLEDIVTDLQNIDDDLIIFQKDELSVDSEVALFKEDEDNLGNDNYLYLLEIDIAKDFINDWVATLQSKPTAKQIALRLFEYAINDA